MKMICLLLAVYCQPVLLFSQNPVKWDFSAKKIADKLYEVHLTAHIQSPWKTYSQNTPEDGPVPTHFTFNKNPLITLEGAVKEVGDLHKKYEDVFGVDVKYYKDQVDFVQIVKLKSKVKTRLLGSLEFMCCNDTQCLPPKKVEFSVRLE